MYGFAICDVEFYGSKEGWFVSMQLWLSGNRLRRVLVVTRLVVGPHRLRMNIEIGLRCNYCFDVEE